MKTYEKPKLIALSLSGNNRLCGDCADKRTLYNETGIARAILELVGGNWEDGITKSDFEGLFGGDEAGCGKPVFIYCKFTSAQQVAWS